MFPTNKQGESVSGAGEGGEASGSHDKSKEALPSQDLQVLTTSSDSQETSSSGRESQAQPDTSTSVGIRRPKRQRRVKLYEYMEPQRQTDPKERDRAMKAIRRRGRQREDHETREMKRILAMLPHGSTSDK